MENQNEKREQLISTEECKDFMAKMDPSVFSKERLKKLIKESKSDPAGLKEFKVLLSKVERCLGKADEKELREYSLHHNNPEIRQMVDEILFPRDQEKTWLYRLGFIPKYTEITLFLMGYTFLLLLTINPLFRREFFEAKYLPHFILIGIVGIILSVYHVFSKRLMLNIEKYLILIYAISISFIVGCYSGIYALEHSQGIWVIFPALNIVSAFFLFFLFRTSVLDKQARKSEIILGIILVSIILFISHYILKNYWAITFSISTFYATNLNEIFNKIFPLKQKTRKIN